jgi:biuret amidohydrolase
LLRAQCGLEGSNLGYRIIVLQDLVRGTNEEMDGAALKMVSLHLGIVMDSADLLAVWRGTEPSRAAAE